MTETKTILIDCDGVLTNNMVYFDSKGGRMKGFHSRDIRAIRELISHGYRVIIFTASSWSGLKSFAERTGAEVMTDRAKDITQFDNFIAVGDDTADLCMLMEAKQAFCPMDADKQVLGLLGINVIPVRGGDGVIVALLNYLVTN